jgi:hypothetical protein
MTAAFPGGCQTIGAPSPVLNYRCNADIGFYWIMPLFNSPVTMYR